MNGVEILSQVERMTWNNFDNFIGALLLIVAIVFLIFSVFWLIVAVFDFSKKNILVFVGFAFACLIAFISFASFMHNTTIHYTEYKVTISDFVNFNEFNEQYEIIDQEGKIYTVKEKDNND